MMGHQGPPQGKLFYTNISLEERIRSNHPLRRIIQLINFDFVYREVADKYGTNGNVSVSPPIILKLMLLLVFYNMRSEKALRRPVEAGAEGMVHSIIKVIDVGSELARIFHE